MSTHPSNGLRLGVAAAALVVLLLGAQGVAALSAPAEPVASTGATLGRTGFEYIGGLRKAVAAVLWNRLDPQFHEYGAGKSISERLEFLPTMRVVQALDPQFEQTYYIAAFVLARNGREEQALDLAREGIANNPKSGLMRASYVQLLVLQDAQGNLPEALKQTRKALEPQITWGTPDDQFEGYGVFRSVFRLAGDTGADAKLAAAQEKIKEQDPLIGTPHEH